MSAPVVPASVTVSPTAIQQRGGIPGLSLPTSADLYKVVLPAALGGALAITVITSLFPKRGTVAAGLMGVTGALLAGTAPLLSLPQEIGLGAFVASGTWLTLRTIGEIPLPSEAAGAAEALPAVTLPDGTRVAFGRRSAA